MNKHEIPRYFLSLRVIGGAFMVAVVLLCVSGLTLWYIRPGPTQKVPATAVLNVISAPTATKIFDTPTPVSELTPSLSVPPSPPPGEIAVGAFVQVSGTGGDGLRIRSEPGLNGELLFLGLEAEVFRVDGGPEEVDNYTWWYLVAPYDESAGGWAVSNFLAVVQNP